MFTDVCYPSNNEEEFLNKAEKLGTGAICFLYKNNESLRAANGKKLTGTGKVSVLKGIYAVNQRSGNSPNADFVFSELKKMPDMNEKAIYLLDADAIAAMLKEGHFTQVHMKELSKKNNVLSLSFNAILKNRNDQKMLGFYFFIIRLCKKYKIKMHFGSYATCPSELRSRKELDSVFLLLGLNSKLLCSGSFV